MHCSFGGIFIFPFGETYLAQKEMLLKGEMLISFRCKLSSTPLRTGIFITEIDKTVEELQESAASQHD